MRTNSVVVGRLRCPSFSPARLSGFAQVCVMPAELLDTELRCPKLAPTGHSAHPNRTPNIVSYSLKRDAYALGRVASHFEMTGSLANEKTVVSIDPDRSNARLRQAKAAEHSRPAPGDCTRPASSQESARAG